MQDARSWRQATLALKLLLEDIAPSSAAAALDWRLLLPLAQRNSVLLRVTETLARGDVPVPDYVAVAVVGERRRAESALQLMTRLSRNCSSHRIPYLFPRTLQHYPDLGGEVDLLILAASTEVDRLVLQNIEAVALRSNLRTRLAGTTAYTIADSALQLEVHHARLGALGEHSRFPALLFAHRRRVLVERTAYDAPTPEDQLVLQAMQKVWGRSPLRLADVLQTIVTVRRGLNWSHVVAVARQVHVLNSLSCYLSYVEQVHGRLGRGRLLPPEFRKALRLEGWGRIAFRDGLFQFPRLQVHRRTYPARLGRVLVAGDWRGAARLCLYPVVAMTAGGRRPSVP